MTDPGLVAQLADLAGISAGYRDNQGNERKTSDATRRALLAAMDLDISSDAAIRAAIDEHRRRPWDRTLPPARVVRDRRHMHVPVRLAAATMEHPHRWRLVTEMGYEYRGKFIPANLAHEGEIELDGETWRCVGLEVPLDPGIGYHELEVDLPSGAQARTRLIVCPPSCHVPARVERGLRIWGLSVQLYALRSANDWGIGDFSRLAELTRSVRDLGGDAVGLNPLHALYPHAPGACAPYSPSSRLFLNVLYIDPECVPDLAEAPRARALMDQPDFRRRVQAARASELVDYAGVAALKRPVLEALFAAFRRRHLDAGTGRGRGFAAFRANGGAALRSHARFEALAEHFPADEDAGRWPEAFRDPDSAEVEDFARRNARRVAFFEYLQWIADEQLAAAGQHALDSGMAIGLYRDLAVSAAGDGAEVWANKGLYASGVSVGSPPDEFNPCGQTWGLPPIIPGRLAESGYAPFIEMLRYNMRHAGALRIDHAMGLLRLYWVPDGLGADEGAYVHYPLSDLLGIVALESRRNRCMVIGEDLGTVPAEVRDAFNPAEVQSYRVLYFEREADGAFRAPHAYPERALATVSTHDLPPLAAYWAAHDLLTRAELELFPSDEVRVEQFDQRAHDREALLTALGREGLLPDYTAAANTATAHLDGRLRRAVQRYLARTPSRLMMVQPEDVLGQREQANLPGTTDEHPNWRRRLPVAATDMGAHPEFRALADALAEEGRGRRVEKPVPVADAAAAPRATYRLQLGEDLTLRDARGLVPYLDALGISHVYLSPVLQARPGSTHGYDVVDHRRIDSGIGDRSDFEALADALHACGMGLILDIVPNHMGVMGADNAWWLDVLENGQASAFAGYFDIDWQPARAELAGRVLLPVLGDHYGVVLEAGELRLELDANARGLAVHYHEHRFPLDPGTWPGVLGYWPERLEAAIGPEAVELTELRDISGTLSGLPGRNTLTAEQRAQREKDKEACRERLAELCAACAGIRAHLDAVCAFFNGLVGEPSSFEPLHCLLEAQAWRLAHWRVAGDEINFRRFFDVNDLAGLAAEREEVFEATHRLVLDLRANGHLDGVRVDHPDGLYDPRGYLRRLARRLESVAPAGAAPAYRVVEKILMGSESLPGDWPVHGTTGYDFANLIGRLFVDARGERGLTNAYHRFVRRRVRFEAEAYQARHLVMRREMAAELATLANRLDRLTQLDWRTRDFTRAGLREALAEVIACFAVYRTYIEPERVSANDRATIEYAVGRAAANARVDPGLLAFVRDVLLLRPDSALGESMRPALADFVMRFQQYSAAVAAKAVEDTAFYRHNRLVSLNEVGGDPGDFAADPARVHHDLAERARAWPQSMLNTATHDAKRGEDVRARLHALSELPDEWRAGVARWRECNRRHRRDAGGRRVPDREDEYLFYQTLVGSWPPAGESPDELFVERVCGYLCKAAREAGRETSWWQPDSAYEQGLEAYVGGVLRDSAFLADFRPIREQVQRLGRANALGQCLIKLTAPGVPDLYQGSEVWQLALVDPDNRRAVDFGALARQMDTVRAIEALPVTRRLQRLATLFVEDSSGLAKQFLVHRVLAVRRALATVFREGDYMPLETAGDRADHVFAFARRHGGAIAVTAVPRLTGSLTDGGRRPLNASVWGASRVRLPPIPDAEGALIDAISGAVAPLESDGDCYAIPCRELFRALPGSLLVSSRVFDGRS